MLAAAEALTGNLAAAREHSAEYTAVEPQMRVQRIAEQRRDIRCPERVKGGKTPGEYIFSELPQIADIVRSAFHDLTNPVISQITTFWVQAIPAGL